MARIFVTVLTTLIAVAAGLYQLLVKPFFENVGYGRAAQSIGNGDCNLVGELKACEKIVLHEPTGVLFLACSTPYSRVHWTPALKRLNASGRSEEDYVATYDPASSRITRFKISGYASRRGLSLHGMDVVPFSSDPNQLYVYLVNHRIPWGGKDAQIVGADSSIEVFKTKLGSDVLEYIRTIEDPVILTPNDIVGSADGKSFYFVNDHGSKLGITRDLEFFGRADGSVGFCRIDQGCKIAISKLHAPNGIAKSPHNETLYVSDCVFGGVNILEIQADNSLSLVDVVDTGRGRGIDNLSVDRDGTVWGAAFVDAFKVLKHFSDPEAFPSPSSAIQFGINIGPESFFGLKYKVDIPFEDDGSLASGITTVVHDSRRGLLFLHGLTSSHLAVCKI